MKQIVWNNARDLTIFGAITVSGLFEQGVYLMLSATVIVVFNSLLVPFVKCMCKKIFKTHKFDDVIDKTLGEVRDEIIKEIKKEEDKDE